jgi:hypothetical protein
MDQMAKKQTRRSISVSRTTYERLKAFCETNHISMSQLVETRVNDFLGGDVLSTTPNTVAVTPAASLPPVMSVARPPVPRPAPVASMSKPVEARPPQAHTTAVLSSQAPVLATSASGPAPFSAPLPSPSPASSPSPSATASPGHSPASPAFTGSAAQSPMTSAAVRFAVDPPPPIIKPRQDTGAPKPAEKRPDQIFTF